MNLNDPQEIDRFEQMLEKAMICYDRALPELAVIDVWKDMLKSYSLRTIGMAFVAYCDSEPEFAPKPASIAARCKVMDGRPTADEAWAIALASRDESDTVIWTPEIAEALSICRPILNLGDEVGARRAFIDAYNRIVTDARNNRRPVQWQASLGFDTARRTAALNKAVADGLLPAPAVATMLPAPDGFEAPTDDKSREGMARVKAALQDLTGAWQANADRRAELAEQRRQEEAQRKAEIADRVKHYRDGQS